MIKVIQNALLNWLFPPLCLHCEEKLQIGGLLFCQGCAGFFELIDPKTRCPYCFAENEAHGPCRKCYQKKRLTLHMASSLDYLGPVATLVQKMKNGLMPHLAKTAEAFMTAQWIKLGWPQPNLIIPVPKRYCFQGYSHSALLTQELAKRLNSPCLDVLKRVGSKLSHAKLSENQKERFELSFKLKKEIDIEGKILLLVDDHIITGITMRKCAEALLDGFPSKIYALSFARSI
jgi:predicted amidophosphoribosyltransferase